MIKRKLSSMMAFLLAVVLVFNTLAPMAYAADGDPDLIEDVEMTRVSLEDFDTYEDTAALSAAYSANANGMANSVELVDSPVEGGGKAMALTYNTAGAGSYSGVYRSVSVNAEGAEALAVWIQGDGMGQRILLQIQHAGGSHKVYLPDLEEFDPASTEPQYLEIPLSAFGPIVTSDIRSFDVYVDGDGDPVTNSTVIVDSVELLIPKTFYTLVVDDFGDYADDAALGAAYAANINGGPNSVALIDSPFEGGGKAMQFTYTLNSAGYSGVYRSINGYWPGAEMISLWFKGDGMGQDILLQLSDGASYEAHLNEVEGFDAASTDWQYLQIPIEQFGPKSGSGTINLKGIQSFALYVNAVGGAQFADSVLAIDDVTVTLTEEPVQPSVIFNETEMYATGNDNLITTLRENITVSSGGELVQVQYEVDDSGILDATTDMVPKGIFRSEGTVNLTVKKAQVYINDAAFVLDLDQDITIHVSDLAEPVQVLDYLMEITGKNLITSMHFDGSYYDADSLHERIANEFGTYPAFYSADFLTGGTVAQRQNMINEVIRQWNNGAIVQIMFHISPPQYTVAQESQGDWGGVQWHERRSMPNRIYSFLYNADWEELMTDGTPLNTNWKLRMDEYARYLQQLEDAGVTVLLRPFHEMNQHVFWWAGRAGLDGTAGLYRMFHDYMEIEKGLTNILWVWDMQDMPKDYGYSSNGGFASSYRGEDVDQSTVLADFEAQDLDSFSPGAKYYDIIALDFYDQGLNAPGDSLDHNHVFTRFWYDKVSEIAKRDGKPMFIGETWAIISPETWQSQPNWSLCMPWGGRTWTHNATGAQGMKEHYQYFLNIEDTPTFATRVKETEKKYVVGLDDYEAYADDAELNAVYTRNGNGGANSVVLIDPDHEGESDQAMQFTYTLNSSGYSGVYRSVNGYWPGLEAISLWFKGDGRGQDILLQLSDGASYEAHLNDVEGFDPASTDWQYLQIPIEQFGPKSGSGVIDLKNIQSFALYVNAVNGTQFANSVLAIDDVSLIFYEEPKLPGVTFNETDMYATGNDNLITTLRDNVTVSGGGELVQVQYEVDDSGILDAATGMVPKGVFRKEGTVKLTVKKAQVYIDDTTFEVDLDQDITIHVSDLAEPVQVLDYLKAITGKNMITGMHFAEEDHLYSNSTGYENADSLHERIARDFGTYPAFFSIDFLNGYTVGQRQNMIDEVIRQWNNGAIVQIMFHISPPQFTVAQESEGWFGSDGWDQRRQQNNNPHSFLYNADWEALMTDGTPLNTNWKLRMDEYARYLQQLEDAGVTVLLRPFHEMNQHVFWWGGRPGLEGTAGLYRMFHDYMEIEKGLSNIIWVWDVQDLPENFGTAQDPKFAPYRAGDVDQSTVLADYEAQDLDAFNPGADYYDIIAVDFYDAAGYSAFWYDLVSEIAQRDGKPMIVGETFEMMSPETWQSQPNWSMLMPWGDYTWGHNSSGVEGMKEHYQHFLNIEDTPTFATLKKVNNADIEAANKAAQEAAEAAEAAKKTAEEAAAAAEAAKTAADAAEAAGAEDKTAEREAAKAAAASADAAKLAADAAADAAGAADAAKKAAQEADPEAAAEAAQDAKASAKIAQDSKAEAQAAQKAAEDAAALAALNAAKDQAKAEVEEYAKGVDADVTEQVKAAKKAISEAKTEEEVAAAVEAAKAAIDAAAGAVDKCPSEKFTDVNADGWYHEAVDFMVENGYMNGVTETLFDIDGSLTRAQLVTILYRIEGEPDVAGKSNPFKDVNDGAWYTDAIVWAADNGIVNGVSPTSYAPDAKITREQIVTILYRYAKAEAAAKDHLAGYTDAGKVSGYAKDAMNWAIANGIINGMTETTLAPTANATRAQICVILMRYLSN